MRSFFVFNHQHKGRSFYKALIKQGWRSMSKDPDLLLVDREWTIINNGEPRKMIFRVASPDSRIVIYPHSALVPWWYDGLVDIHPRVNVVLVIGEGQREVMRRIDPSIPVRVVGWPWCKQRKFVRPKKIRRILFAPIHCSGNGDLRPEAVKANQWIIKELRNLLAQKIVDQVRILKVQVLSVSQLLLRLMCWQDKMLAGQNVESATSVSKSSIAQIYVLTGQNINSATSVSNPAIIQNHVLAGQNIESASSINQSNINQTHVLISQDIEIASSVEKPNTNQFYSQNFYVQPLL